MYCNNCGNEVNDAAVVCVKCGAPIIRQSNSQNNTNFGVNQNASNGYSSIQNSYDSCFVSGGMKFLCFLIPLLGLILFATESSKNPVKAKQYLGPSIAGFIISAIFSVIYTVIIML